MQHRNPSLQADAASFVQLPLQQPVQPVHQQTTSCWCLNFFELRQLGRDDDGGDDGDDYFTNCGHFVSHNEDMVLLVYVCMYVLEGLTAQKWMNKEMNALYGGTTQGWTRLCQRGDVCVRQIRVKSKQWDVLRKVVP